jgi:hypothetical protein
MRVFHGDEQSSRRRVKRASVVPFIGTVASAYRWVIGVAFMLGACAAGPEDVTLAVTAEHFDAVDALDQEWEAVGVDVGRLTVVVDDGELVGDVVRVDFTHPHESLRTYCEAPTGPIPLGCVARGRHTIYIASDAADPYGLLRHEMGHLIRGKGGAHHLGERAGCSPADAPQSEIVAPHVMCPHEGARELDAADGAFVMRR